VKTRLVEATNGFNHGKFLLGRLTREWAHASALEPQIVSLPAYCGWGPEHLWVLDLATGEGAFFRPGGFAAADLRRHRILVCPLFEPFLEWLYGQDLFDLDTLPDLVKLPHAPAAFHGYRRPGPLAAAPVAKAS